MNENKEKFVNYCMNQLTRIGMRGYGEEDEEEILDMWKKSKLDSNCPYEIFNEIYDLDSERNIIEDLEKMCKLDKENKETEMFFQEAFDNMDKNTKYI